VSAGITYLLVGGAVLSTLRAARGARHGRVGRAWLEVAFATYLFSTAIQGASA
jgi:hypothetical protein